MNHYVGLEISMCESFPMHDLQAFQQLLSYDLGIIFFNVPLKHAEVTLREVLHGKKYLIGILEPG